MRWAAAAALAMTLAPLWASAQPASPPAPTSTTLAAQPAAAAVPAPGICASAPWKTVRSLLPKAPTRGLVVASMVLADGEGADVLMIGPVGQHASPDALKFRVFLADGRGDVLPAPGQGAVEIMPSHVDPPTDEMAKALKVDPAGALDLHLVIPRENDGWTPWHGRVLVVVACQAGAPVAYGFRGVQESRRYPAWAISGGLILLLYLLAATMVWQSRRRAIEASATDNVQPPMRITVLEPWSWAECLDPVVMTSDEFDRGSLSNLQVLFFGGLVAFGLTALALRSGALSDLSPAILYLLGIPALGTLGTGLAKRSRDRLSAENWAWLVARGVLPANDAGKKLRPRWSDLIMTDTVLDLPKLQALTFSLIVGIAMVVTGFRDFAHFNVPTNLLGILGLSQIVFVGGRFTQPTTIGDLDDVLSDLRGRAATLRKAAANGIDVDPDGKPVPLPTGALPPAPRGPYLTLADAAQPGAVPNAAQRYRDLEEEAAVLLRALFERDVHTAGLADPFLPAG